MFTGIIENMGTVVRVLRRGGGARLEVRAPWLTPHLSIGESVSINGSCVTVTEFNEEMFACDLVPETVARTNLGILQTGEHVNLERPVRAADRLGGHIVQGHVDAVGLVRSRRKVGAQEMLEVTVPFELTRYLAPQGSVSVDGVSLTVVAVDRDRFRVALIPHTVQMTTLGRKIQGAPVNVEVDVLSKYVERHIAARQARPSIQSLFEDVPREREVQPLRPQPLRPASTGTAPRAAAGKTPVRPMAVPKAKPQRQLGAAKGSASKASSRKRSKGPARPATRAAKTAKRPAARRRR